MSFPELPSSEYWPSQRATWAAGQPISELMARGLAEPQLISLAAGLVDQQTLPIGATQSAIRSLWSDADAVRNALQYGTTPGLPALRQLLSDRFSQDNSGSQPPPLEQIVVTAGSNQLLHLVSECLLDPGDIVLCAAPTYFVYLGTLANLGACSYGVAVDEYGMVPDALEAAFQYLEHIGQLDRVKAIYLVPYFDNPCGMTMPLERRAEIVDLAKRWSSHHRIHVIADEVYRDLRFTGPNVPSTATVDEEGDTVIVTSSFSKSFSPGMRVGWGILPKHLVAPACDQKGNIDFGSPNLNQHLMAHILEQGLFDGHVETICNSYQQKLSAMLQALDQHVAGLAGVRWRQPLGGLYVWLALPEGVNANIGAPLFEAAIDEGVLYVPGSFCYPTAGEPVCTNRLRLSFGVQTPEKISQGVALLAQAIRAVVARGASDSVAFQES